MTSLVIKPDRWTFPKTGGTAKFKLTSNCTKRQVFKCTVVTNGPLYKFNPAEGIIPPKGSLDIEVVRANGPDKQDEMFVTFSPVDDAFKDVKQMDALPELFQLQVPFKSG